MSESTLIPLLEEGGDDRSVIVGAPEEFDFRAALKTATAVRIAMAFGHMSGWKEIEENLTGSSAVTIHILLGQAFFQTEPTLLLRTMALQRDSKAPRFEVRLASANGTFHPKVWIIDNNEMPFCIVGSGNLSRGGLLRNVECGVLTNESANVNTLRHWFDRQWVSTEPVARTYEQYIAKYHQISAARKVAEAKVEAATKELADQEARWRHKRAIDMAAAYWRTEKGMLAVKAREIAIGKMRNALDYPSFDFGVDQWREFLRIPELGRFRLGHEARTIAGLSQLRARLKKLVTSSVPVAKSVEMLQEVSGIGRNLATKLLAVHRPEQFIVVNGPVESALRAFGYEIEMSTGITGANYVRVLKDLAIFIEECEIQNLRAATALDAFFYEYKDEPSGV